MVEASGLPVVLDEHVGLHGSAGGSGNNDVQGERGGLLVAPDKKVQITICRNMYEREREDTIEEEGEEQTARAR
jgi:hypothetical protein